MLGCMTFSSSERRRLADLFLEVGPDAPTLCDGWTTKDLAVHLLLRETNPLAAAGILVPAAEGLLDKATAREGERDYRDIVRDWAEGPGRFNIVRYLDPVMNTAEHFIHHEDVRRGGGAVERREFSAAVNEQLHKTLKTIAPRMLSKSSVPVILQPTDQPRIVTADKRGVSPDGDAVVRVSGDVGELLLWVYGRDAVEVTIDGNADDIRRSSL